MSKSSRKRAAILAEGWLRKVSVQTEMAKSLQCLGILLCQKKMERVISLIEIYQDSKAIPPMNILMSLSRSDVLQLSQNISMSPISLYNMNVTQKQQTGWIFGALAVSYAQENDLSVVSAIVRAAAHLNFCNPLLEEAEIFILDQQHPDGYFGLISLEIASINDETIRIELMLRLTVEALWALSEI